MKRFGGLRAVLVGFVFLVGGAVVGPSYGQLAPTSLFKSSDVVYVTSSPKGNWVVAKVFKDGTYGLLAQRIGTARVSVILRSQDDIGSVIWIDENTMYVGFVSAGGSQRAWQMQITRLVDSADEIIAEYETIQVRGRMADSLPLVENEVLWEFRVDGETSIHRVSLSDLKENSTSGRWRNRKRFGVGEEVARVEGDIDRWILDKSGMPRAALRRDESGFTTLTRDPESNDWREVYQFDGSNEKLALYPWAIESDGRELIVAAYNGHDTLGLHVFDIAESKIVRELLVRSDVDITSVIVDYANRELIAGAYEDNGETHYHYLEGYAERYLGEIKDRLRKSSVSVVSSNDDRTRFVLWVSGARNPGIYYYHDSKTGELLEIAKAYQSLDPEDLVEVESFRATSEDGLSVEAFLALPKEIPEGGAPLVVIPHGGPLGVRDSREFNPLLQYLASWGFAVLNVNYRGSSGYGLEFEEAGKRQWALGIEDDIDAATEVAMARSEIDETRLCIAGGSYGGFSALASIVRHQSRYRCAVTINGVTDIPLLFESSDWSYIEEILPIQKEAIGDVKANRQALMRDSPLYHVDQIETPVMIIYGTEDVRVDPDHAHRLMLMMNLLGKKFEAIEVVGAAHSFTDLESQHVFPKMLEFLSKYLMPVDPVELESNP